MGWHYDLHLGRFARAGGQAVALDVASRVVHFIMELYILVAKSLISGMKTR